MQPATSTDKVSGWMVGRRFWGNQLIDREIFTTLLEAKVLIKSWRKEYNQVRPHSSLDYRPPAPEAIQPVLIATTLTF